MSATGTREAGVQIPTLQFNVTGARSAEHAAVPTLQFELQIDVAQGRPIRSILLDIQIQIAARRRAYSGSSEERLLELFGTPDRWATTLRTLPWTRSTMVVPPFETSTSIELPVVCTYDLEVTASRYFAALDEGEVPLEFLFSGSVFFSTPAQALQAARIAWDSEVEYSLPVAVWKETMGRHFPDSAWLRVGEKTFQRLCAYKARGAFTSWDATIEALIERGARR